MVSDKDRVCSFCGKGVADVEVMVTGDGDACICAVCIVAALKIVEEHRGRRRPTRIESSPGRRRRAPMRQSVKPSEHQVAILEELLAGGYIVMRQPVCLAPWRLIDRDGSEWRDAIRVTTIDRLTDERWIERPDNLPKASAGEHRWSITATGRLALARHREGDFGLVMLKGGKA